MVKILFFIESLSGGGAERVLTELVENLDRSKYLITVATETDSEQYTQRIEAVARHKCFAKRPKGKNPLKKLYNILIFKFSCVAPLGLVKTIFFGNRYDIEVAFCEGYATKMIAASANKKCKKFAWFHSDVMNFHWTATQYKNIEDELNTYKKFDKICCVSDSVRKSFNSKFGLAEKTVTLYNPLDAKKIIARSQEGCNLEPINCLRIVTAGRLTPIKRFDRLINIAGKLKRSGYSFEILIMGIGEEEKNLINLIETNDVGDCVKLLGFKTNPFPYIKASDFFVCSSEAEGMSTIATECLMLGKPIITTECSGTKELFGDYNCGIICKNDEDALYETVKKMLDFPELLTEFSCNCIERSKFFQLDRMIESIESIING